MIVDQRTDLADWVRDEQHILWHDLNDAIGSAINGRWSIKAGSIARRIVEAARLVGPTGHGDIPWSLTAGGVYEAVLRAGGIEPELPTEAEWRQFDEQMAKYGTRASLQPQFAGTVAAINEPREQRWIRFGDD